jgi:hypothetical protein
MLRVSADDALHIFANSISEINENRSGPEIEEERATWLKAPVVD